MSERVFFHTAHKALWNWLSKHPVREKLEWPGWKRNGGNVKDSSSNCLACDFAGEVEDDEDVLDVCDCCPLDFPYKRCVRGKSGETGLFRQWGKSNISWRRSDLAAQIRDLPVREGVVCK